jgi:Tfp pilus assembly protein PilF
MPMEYNLLFGEFQRAMKYIQNRDLNKAKKIFKKILSQVSESTELLKMDLKLSCENFMKHLQKMKHKNMI